MSCIHSTKEVSSHPCLYGLASKMSSVRRFRQLLMVIVNEIRRTKVLVVADRPTDTTHQHSGSGSSFRGPHWRASPKILSLARLLANQTARQEGNYQTGRPTKAKSDISGAKNVGKSTNTICLFVSYSACYISTFPCYFKRIGYSELAKFVAKGLLESWQLL